MSRWRPRGPGKASRQSTATGSYGFIQMPAPGLGEVLVPLDWPDVAAAAAGLLAVRRNARQIRGTLDYLSPAMAAASLMHVQRVRDVDCDRAVIFTMRLGEGIEKTRSLYPRAVATAAIVATAAPVGKIWVVVDAGDGVRAVPFLLPLAGPTS